MNFEIEGGTCISANMSEPRFAPSPHRAHEDGERTAGLKSELLAQRVTEVQLRAEIARNECELRQKDDLIAQQEVMSREFVIIIS